MIIDFHTHRYAEAVRRDPASWGREMGESHWVKLVTDGPQGWPTPEETLRLMDAEGVGQAVLAGWYWENQDTADLQNAWHREWAGADPARWIPFISVQPRAGARAVKALEAALATGIFRGIGELMPTVQGFDVRGPVFRDIVTLAIEHGLPILLHVTEPVGHHYPGRVETPLEDFVWLAEAYPEACWVLAHWGGGLPFYCLNRRVGRALRHVYFDTAASPLLYDARVWRAVRDLVGAERILFGTDFPLRLYPRKESQPGYARVLTELRAAGLTPEEERAILSGNARRLLFEDDFTLEA
jgi:predicted TIM-barrel fold metal-dependent hydrolase